MNSDQNMDAKLSNFTDVFGDEIENSQPISLSPVKNIDYSCNINYIVNSFDRPEINRPAKGTGQRGDFRSIEEIDQKYRSVFSYPLFNFVQSKILDDALYSDHWNRPIDNSLVVCAPTGSGKTVAFEMAIVRLLMELDDTQYVGDFKIIYMAPVKAVCTERLTEWYPKFTPLGLLCIEVTGDTDVDFHQLKAYRIIITTPEKWDMLTRRWSEHRSLAAATRLLLIDEVHILNDAARGPVLEAVVSRMKAIEAASQSAYRLEQLQRERAGAAAGPGPGPGPAAGPTAGPARVRLVAVSATVGNPEDVAAWLGTADRPAVVHRYGDECRPVKLHRVVEGYPCAEGTSIFKFDIILSYRLWPLIQKYYNGKPTLIFCNTRKSVVLTAETLSKEITISFTPELQARLNSLAALIKNKKIQSLILCGVGCHHAGLLYEERTSIEQAFRNKILPILITTTTLAMGVNLPAHLVIIKNTQQYVNGSYQEYSASTVLQMVGRAGRPQYDAEATAVIMTRVQDKPRYQALVGGSEPLQSYLHKRLAENLNSEVALGTVTDVAQCVHWLRSTFLYTRAAKDPRRYLGLPSNAPPNMISKKIEELCVKAMNGLASAGLINMDEASCIESTEAGRLMSIYYLDFETMKLIMKIDGTENLERMLCLVCESHELSEMHLRIDERRCLNALNRNSSATTIRFPMKGKITTKQMKVNCIIQACLGCLHISEPSLNQESLKIMKIADRICKCIVSYMTRSNLINQQPKFYNAILSSIMLAKCVSANIWENSPYVSKQLRGIGPTFSTLLATAGKVNFMLLEESHPRDLERIMNKGPPAGNILRKQISLLPKYQLTMNPMDEKSVTIQLQLLNQSHLKENIDALTATAMHQSYVIIGDSENHILLLTSFRDKNLINLYDGTITYTITRKHPFEHKIHAHCISADFVGIDAHSTYTFSNLYSVLTLPCKDAISSKTNKIERPSKDIIKEPKKKQCQFKEQVKRQSALLEKINSLKESFSKTSRQESNSLINEISQHQNRKVRSNETTEVQTNIHTCDDIFDSDVLEDRDMVDLAKTYDDKEGFEPYLNDQRIDGIISNIEKEMSKKHNENFQLPAVNMHQNNKPKAYITKIHEPQIALRNRKSQKKLDNFSFIDKLNKTDSEVDKVPDIDNSKSSISESVKKEIEKFLKSSEDSYKRDNDVNKITSDDYSNYVEPLTETDISDALTQKLTPEIVDLTNIEKDESNDTRNKLHEDYFDEHNEQNTESIFFEDKKTDRMVLEHYLCENKLQDRFKTLHSNEQIELELHNNITKEPFIKKNNVNCVGILDTINTQPDLNTNYETKSEKLEKIKAHSYDYLQTKLVTSTIPISDVLPQFTHIMKEPNIYDNQVRNAFQQISVIPKSIRVQQTKNFSALEPQPLNTVPPPKYISAITDQIKDVNSYTNNMQNSYPGSAIQNYQHFHKTRRIDTLGYQSISTVPNGNKDSHNEIMGQNSCSENSVIQSIQEVLNQEKNTPNEDIATITMASLPREILDVTQMYDQNNFEHSVEPTIELAMSRDNRNNTSDRYPGYNYSLFNTAFASSPDYRDTKKYTYTTTQVDVWTKKTNNEQCTMQVVKKVKLDVDITTIVTKEKTKQVNNKDTGKGNDTSLHKVIDCEYTTPSPKPNNNDLSNSYNSLKHDIMDSTKEIEDEKENTPNKTKETANPVQDILRKFSMKLKQKQESTPPQIITELQTNSNSQVKCRKRPFNITDIDNVDVDLPKTLFNIPSTTTTNFEIFSQQNKSSFFQDNLRKQREMTSMQSAEGECLYDTVENLTPILNDEYVTSCDEVPKSEYQTEDSNYVDQSLLDPKTFLSKCFESDDQIDLIPPPLEFGDVNKSTNSNLDETFNNYNSKGACNRFFNYNDDSRFNYIDDVVHENNGSEQSSSQFNVDNISTETWTLDNDELQQMNRNNNMSDEMFVIRRGSSSHPARTLVNNKYSPPVRKYKLDQFKLNRKQKFQFRKH